jgi:predicted metal-dependent enzyme (double-stranded beta helix superfamily)
MVMDAVVERCVEQSPVTVMARLALQRALEPAWVDELFERECGTQYTRELLFSTTVELMSVVAVGLRPSVHAPPRHARTCRCRCRRCTTRSGAPLPIWYGHWCSKARCAWATC